MSNDDDKSDWSDGSSFSLIEAEGLKDDDDADTTPGNFLEAFIAASVIVEWPPSPRNFPDERPSATNAPSINLKHQHFGNLSNNSHDEASLIDVVCNEKMEDEISSGGSEISAFDEKKSADTDDQTSAGSSCSSYYHVSRSDVMSIGSSCDSTTFEKISSSSSSWKVVVQENVHLRQELQSYQAQLHALQTRVHQLLTDHMADLGAAAAAPMAPIRMPEEPHYVENWILQERWTSFMSPPQSLASVSPSIKSLPLMDDDEDHDGFGDDEVKDDDDDEVKDDDSVYKDDYTLYATSLARGGKSSLSQAISFNDNNDENDVSDDDDDDSLFKDDYIRYATSLAQGGKYSPRSVTSYITRSRSGIVVPRVIDLSGKKLESIINNALPDTISVKAKQIVDPYGEKGIYSGVLSKSTGMPHGIGRLEYEKVGRWYAGGWIHGRWNGYGRLSNGDGDFYEGGFKNERKHGTSVMKFADGRIFEGEYIRGEMNQGKMTYQDGSVYEGPWRDGMRHGRGKCNFVDGSEYEGEFREGNFHGHGQMTWSDGGWYVGEWCEGEMHGKGKEIRPTGSLRHDGEWSRGEPIRSADDSRTRWVAAN